MPRPLASHAAEFPGEFEEFDEIVLVPEWAEGGQHGHQHPEREDGAVEDSLREKNRGRSLNGENKGRAF